MVKRWLIAIVLGALVLTDLSVAAASFGIAGTTGLFLGTTRNLDSERALVTALNPTAIRDGVHVGDIYDFRLLSLPERAILFTGSGRSGTSVSTPLVRGSRVVRINVAFTPRTGAAGRTAALVWLGLAFLAAFAGIFIVVRGKGNASLAAGVVLLIFADFYVAKSLSHAIVPVWLILSLNLASAIFFVISFRCVCHGAVLSSADGIGQAAHLAMDDLRSYHCVRHIDRVDRLADPLVHRTHCPRF